MTSPLKPPEGSWWSQSVNRRESIWLGLSGIWSLIIFGWMSGWTRFGDQNPIGQTFDVSPEDYQQKLTEYRENAEETEEGLLPPGEDVYIAGQRFNWLGTPVILEAGREYDIHLSSLDVQHGFSIRPESTLSKHTNLQVLPGYEWVIPMTFDQAGTYHVICNEFCGTGHRTMHGRVVVRGE